MSYDRLVRVVEGAVRRPITCDGVCVSSSLQSIPPPTWFVSREKLAHGGGVGISVHGNRRADAERRLSYGTFLSIITGMYYEYTYVCWRSMAQGLASTSHLKAASE